jgi:biopolymer transport protein ExbD
MHGPAMEEDEGQIAAINVIPLVDIVLVLLIIFMVTTVFTKDSAIPLDLPKGSRPEQVQQPPVQITVSVEQNGNILLNGKPTELEELGTKINGFLNQNTKTLLVLRGDKRTVYGKIIPVLDEVSRTGVQITLALQPGPPE